MRELRVSPIKKGTVIDHIKARKALKVFRIMGIPEDFENVISILMNVESRKMKRKDVIKIEGIELDQETLNKIALISPNATINIIEDYKVVRKYKVQIPKEIYGIVKCSNPNCITNSEEPLTPKFDVISKDPVRIRCKYCGRIMSGEEIEENII